MKTLQKGEHLPRYDQKVHDHSDATYNYYNLFKDGEYIAKVAMPRIKGLPRKIELTPMKDINDIYKEVLNEMDKDKATGKSKPKMEEPSTPESNPHGVYIIAKRMDTGEVMIDGEYESVVLATKSNTGKNSPAIMHGSYGDIVKIFGGLMEYIEDNDPPLAMAILIEIINDRLGDNG